jgi:raffinose/stachyose/melibiose transport system permease protein
MTVLTRADEVRSTEQRTTRRSKPRDLWAIAFLAPAGLLLLAFVLVPSVLGGLFAFTNWNGLSWNFDWVGVQNFVTFAQDPGAYGALLHTLVITVVVVIGQNLLGLLLAVALNSSIKSRNVLRVLFFAPVLVTPVIIAYLWGFIFSANGPMNAFLAAIGLGEFRQVWLGNPDLALWGVIMVILWQFSGYLMVIYLAGLQSVPDELVEAARLDGAGSVRIFFAVTLPFLKPAVVIGILLVTIGGLKTFDQVWVLTGGGPGTATQTLATIVYQTAFEFGRYGYATAIALVMTVLIIIFSLIQVRITRRRADDS